MLRVLGGLSLISVLIVLSGCQIESPRPIAAQQSPITTPHFEITYADITPEQAMQFADKADRAYADVTTYLGKSHPTPIPIAIGDQYRLPRASNGRITIPASRIRGDAGGDPEIRGRGPGIVHEVTHIVAPSRNQSNRFLDEGLAVYMQEKFGDDASYPNMGEDVHHATVRLIDVLGTVIPLAEAEQRRRSRQGGLARRVAYLEEGSFVRFLIETYGLELFLSLYDGQSYQSVYGKGLPELEQEWLTFLRLRRPQDT